MLQRGWTIRSSLWIMILYMMMYSVDGFKQEILPWDKNCTTITRHALYCSDQKLHQVDRYLNLAGRITIDYSRNFITSVDAPVFDTARDVTVLNLSHNSLQIIKSGSFRGTIKLARLYLNHNLIRLIESGAFKGLKKLTVLWLYSNFYLRRLPVGIFSGIHLQDLLLNHQALELASYCTVTNKSIHINWKWIDKYRELQAKCVGGAIPQCYHNEKTQKTEYYCKCGDGEQYTGTGCAAISACWANPSLGCAKHPSCSQTLPRKCSCSPGVPNNKDCGDVKQTPSYSCNEFTETNLQNGVIPFDKLYLPYSMPFTCNEGFVPNGGLTIVKCQYDATAQKTKWIAKAQCVHACPTDWIYSRGVCLNISATTAPYSESVVACERRGASLAYIHDSLYPQYWNMPEVWIGIRRPAGSQQFEWHSSQAAAKTTQISWKVGFPPLPGPEVCGVKFYPGRSRNREDWFTMPCTEYRKYICAKAACPFGWIGSGELCLYRSDEKATYDDSVSACKRRGASLAYIQDSIRHADGSYVNMPELWIGIIRYAYTHIFKWHTSQKDVQTNETQWKRGYPGWFDTITVCGVKFYPGPFSNGEDWYTLPCTEYRKYVCVKAPRM